MPGSGQPEDHWLALGRSSKAIWAGALVGVRAQPFSHARNVPELLLCFRCLVGEKEETESTGPDLPLERFPSLESQAL